MKIEIGTSINSDSKTAIQECLDQIKIKNPSYILSYLTSEIDAQVVYEGIKNKYPDTKVIGATSCLGILTQKGFIGKDGRAVGIFASEDSDGEYSVGQSTLESPTLAAEDACKKAMSSCGHEGEQPDFVWMLCSPGDEEKYLQGIQDTLGEGVTVYGGSCGDNGIEGKWKLLGSEGVSSEGLVLLFGYTSNPPCSSFLGGFEPTDKKAIVTKASGRVLYELDHKSALHLYSEWTENAFGEIPDKITEEKSVLEFSSLHPLGREKAKINSIGIHLLSHPEAVTKDGGLRLFTEIKEGDELTLMQGSKDSIKERPREILQTLLNRENIKVEEIKGVLLVYCAGCLLTVGPEAMDSVGKDIQSVIGDKPLFGAFTFGEQGSLLGENNFHGNLMVSVTVFK